MDFTSLTEYLDSLYEEFDIPQTDCAIAQNHKIIYRRTTGWRDHAKTQPLLGNETYFVYSVSKMFTVTSVMQLVERGKITLDDPLCKFIPEYENTFVTVDGKREPLERQPKVRHLLTMTAGMPGNLSGANAMSVIADMRKNGIEAGTLDLVRATAADGLIYQPGSHFLYSSCHDVLAAVIEVVSGLKYIDYIKENICLPLDMHSTGVSSNTDVMSRMADQYWYRDGKSVPHTKTNFAELTANHQNGGASIVSSVEDCLTLADALACSGEGKTGARILKSETVDLMRTPALSGTPLEDYDKILKTGYNYGLGVRTLVDKTASKSPIGEFGWDGAAGAFFLSDTENKLSLYLAHHTVALTPGDGIHFRVRDLMYEALGL